MILLKQSVTYPLQVILTLIVFSVCIEPINAAEKSTTKVYGELKDDMALVYFIRPGMFGGSGRIMYFFAEDQFLGTAPNNSYGYAYLEPGRHLFWLVWAGLIRTKEAEMVPGKTYYLTISSAGTTRIEFTNEQEGLALIDQVKSYSTPTDKEIQKATKHIEKKYAEAQQRLDCC